MKKGFTLLELLGIIILLGVIILVAVPALIQSNKNAEIKTQKEFDSIVNTACISYIQIHSTEYEKLLGGVETSKQIPLSALIEEGYLKGTTKNPKTNETLDNESTKTITATYVSGEIKCTYN